MNRYAKKRRGHPFIEVTIMVSLVSGILATSGVVLQKIYKLYDDSMRQWAIQRSLQSLSQRWQEDIHASSLVKISSNDTVEIRGKGLLIYRLDTDRNVIRQNWKNEKLVGIDRYSLNFPVDIEFTKNDSGRVPILGMRIGSRVANQPKILATLYARLGIEEVYPENDSKQEGEDAR